MILKFLHPSKPSASSFNKCQAILLIVVFIALLQIFGLNLYLKQFNLHLEWKGILDVRSPGSRVRDQQPPLKPAAANKSGFGNLTTLIEELLGSENETEGNFTQMSYNMIADLTAEEFDNETSGDHNSTQGQCPLLPKGLVGRQPVKLEYPTFEALKQMFPSPILGGHWRPSGCEARQKVALIIPYRDRESHLRAFLHNLHDLLRKQEMDYAIYVIEQTRNQTFNRGKLMNVGFVEASKDYDWNCYIFHDVDLLPENDLNLYRCHLQSPRHMSVAVDKMKYVLPYAELFGGASAIPEWMFRKINGFSNDYWGWGAEDDDIATRLRENKLKIVRSPITIAMYKMLKHGHESNRANPCRHKIYRRTRFRWRKDGLSNLEYRLIELEKNDLFTRLEVDLLEERLKKIKCRV